jgi:hypothetical protein
VLAHVFLQMLCHCQSPPFFAEKRVLFPLFSAESAVSPAIFTVRENHTIPHDKSA